MKIGIDARIAKWHIGSGLGNYTKNMIKNLKAIDHENEYILFTSTKEEKYGWFRSENEVSSGKIKEFWKLIYESKWENQPQVDIFHNMTNGIGVPSKGDYKLVITIKDMIPYVMPKTVNEQHLEYVLKYTPKVIEKADKIITTSNHSKKDIERYFHLPKEKVSVIYYAPDKIFRPLEKNKAKEIIKEKYGIKNKFILYVGGFSSRKNIERLIRAFHMIHNEFEEEYKLVILGDTSLTYESLNKLVKELSIEEKVIFTGFVEKKTILYFYNGCEAFVYPSLYEGFSLPPLEAAACGVPIITSKVSSIPEIMGNCCIYINPYDVINIAQTIYDTIIDKDLRMKLSQQSLKHSKKYSWKRTSEEIVEVYKHLM
ncbi:glycosyltransferase family 4 protein [Crassaminicella profunda]|uniref:glycosyltransferase family 4 protein n=1 Tax=Crassaminicella profunda TaxID=1286698 RepID=UPI001CA65673|nr:glycosyltransferase family 1 protein [Crassaminicella profunda]QZY56509.1 glycosyltransferase family 4 protein [Crassaminicella profunda]